MVSRRTIYDRPVRELLHDMVADLGLRPGQIFTASRAREWFQTKYPRIRPAGVTAHLSRLSTNDKNRLHHSWADGDDLLFRVASGQYRLYEPGKDPAPIRELVEGDVAREELLEPEDEEVEAEAEEGSSKFLLEKDLQRYLAENLGILERGLTLYRGDDATGMEFEAGDGRRIDILATDAKGSFVVIELKVSRGYDRVIGQLLRYVNWVRQNLCEAGQSARGIIVCRAITNDLRLACAGLPNIQLFEYQLSVTVKGIDPIAIP